MGSHEIKPYDTSWTGKKDVNLREYTNLYVDSKVEDPLGDSIKLGFISDLEDIIFHKDQYTYFHFPMKEVGSGNSNEYVKIKQTTIIDDGATYGSCPYKSDRIYKLRYNYEDTSPYGRAQPEFLSNGTWLCSWLSGDVLHPEIQPKWMDRWFDPTVTNATAAEQVKPGLDGKGEYYNKDFGVYDKESEMSFDYGAYYKYWRVGEKTISGIADSIGTGNSLKIHLTDWKNEVDASAVKYVNSGDGSFYNYRVSNDFDNNDYAVTFNGTDQLLIIPYTDENKGIMQDEYSIVFWVKCDDWKNCSCYSIIDNMFMGGWKFGITNRAKNSFIFVFGNDSSNPLQDGTTGLFNNKGELVSTKAYWKADDNPNLLDMIIDPELFTYVLDYDSKNNISKIHKVDYNGNRLCTLEIKDVELQYLDLSSYKSGYALYAYAVNGNTVVAYKVDRYNMTYERISSTSVKKVKFAPVVKIENDFFLYDKTKYWLNEDTQDTNDGFEVEVGSKLKYYKYNDSLDTRSIAVDHDNVVYVLKEDKVEKWEVLFHIYQKTDEFKVKAGINPTMIDIVNRHINGKNVDQLLVISEDKQCVYVYDTNGSYVDEYDTSRFYVRPKNKRRVTMYDYFRINKSQTDVVYFDLMGFGGHNIISKELSLVSDSEWHQMAATIKRQGNDESGKPVYELSFFFDCEIVGEPLQFNGDFLDQAKKFAKSTKYYYDSPIVIGGRCGKIFPLMQEINVCNKSFNGSIDDFRIYNRAITQEDLYYIYMSKFVCDDMTWHFKMDRRNLVENIERFYKLKMPGSKSAHYVLHINGYKNSDGKIDDKLKLILEKMIRRSLKKLTPAYSSLIKIEWD